MMVHRLCCERMRSRGWHRGRLHHPAFALYAHERTSSLPLLRFMRMSGHLISHFCVGCACADILSPAFALDAHARTSPLPLLRFMRMSGHLISSFCFGCACADVNPPAFAWHVHARTSPLQLSRGMCMRGHHRPPAFAHSQYTR